MINGIVVGVVIDNKDPDKLARVKVKYPVDHETPPETSWVRQMWPMAGPKRGWVIIPDVGTEVVIGFAYRTMTPYILGGVYNGDEDKPEPYANEDENDDHRVFWSRNSHWIDFDDTPGKERIELISTTEGEAIYQELHAANKVITTKTKKDIIVEAKETISFKCKDWKVEASTSIAMEGKQTVAWKSGGTMTEDGGGSMVRKGGTVSYNEMGVSAPMAVKPTPEHRHPPTKPEGENNNEESEEETPGDSVSPAEAAAAAAVAAAAAAALGGAISSILSAVLDEGP
ncbi:MAG: hypothetical protein FJ102_20790, partial [Deltaproteobacteria bacterium]|nr:hypothetical protein [Deltaproteobacteria bacterium]